MAADAAVKIEDIQAFAPEAFLTALHGSIDAAFKIIQIAFGEIDLGADERLAPRLLSTEPKLVSERPRP